MRRRRSSLNYSVPSATSPFVVLADSFFRVAGKRSAGEWRRACEASLRASRRRRGLDADVRLVASPAMAREIARLYEVPEHLVARQEGEL